MSTKEVEAHNIHKLSITGDADRGASPLFVVPSKNNIEPLLDLDHHRRDASSSPTTLPPKGFERDQASSMSSLVGLGLVLPCCDYNTITPDREGTEASKLGFRYNPRYHTNTFASSIRKVDRKVKGHSIRL